mmetsp:Transcript_53/g.132  ORF Transcript_53/g.132 Transcript_53/m.132 type:complete len:297 (-) Transcript_53:327-1217(-)
MCISVSSVPASLDLAASASSARAARSAFRHARSRCSSSLMTCRLAVCSASSVSRRAAFRRTVRTSSSAFRNLSSPMRTICRMSRSWARRFSISVQRMLFCALVRAHRLSRSALAASARRSSEALSACTRSVSRTRSSASVWMRCWVVRRASKRLSSSWARVRCAWTSPSACCRSWRSSSTTREPASCSSWISRAWARSVVRIWVNMVSMLDCRAAIRSLCCVFSCCARVRARRVSSRSSSRLRMTWCAWSRSSRASRSRRSACSRAPWVCSQLSACLAWSCARREEISSNCSVTRR